jgi:hypothetical protein
VAIRVNGRYYAAGDTLIDSAANVHLITKEAALSLNLTWTEAAGTSLLTSNEGPDGPSPTLGMTPMVELVYGVGLPNAIRRLHSFMVVDTPAHAHTFDLLLGNLDMQENGGMLDTGSLTFTLYPAFHTAGTRASVINLPVAVDYPRNRVPGTAGAMAAILGRPA